MQPQATLAVIGVAALMVEEAATGVVAEAITAEVVPEAAAVGSMVVVVVDSTVAVVGVVGTQGAAVTEAAATAEVKDSTSNPCCLRGML